MLAPLSMTNAKYQQWKRSSIPYVERLVDDLDYNKFSETRLMPSFSVEVCIHMVILKCDAYVRVQLVLLPAV